MKFFSARRLTRIYYQIDYSKISCKIDAEDPCTYFIKKWACICFIGFPIKYVKEIYVPAHNDDLK